MSLFDLLILHQQSQSQPGKPALTLPYVQLPAFVPFDIIRKIKGIEPLYSEVEVTIQQSLKEYQSLWATITFEDHEIAVLGFPTPLPQDVYEKNVEPSFWSPAFKDSIKTAQTHVLLTYTGTNTSITEQYIALYKVAKALLDGNLLGVINEPAWTAHSIKFLQEVIHPNMVNICRESPPLLFWTGLVRIIEEQASWYVTRGFHVFNQPDLAIYAEDAHLQEIQQLFFDIYEYAFQEQVVLKEGMVMAFEQELAWELVEPPAEEYLSTPLGVLALVPTEVRENE